MHFHESWWQRLRGHHHLSTSTAVDPYKFLQHPINTSSNMFRSFLQSWSFGRIFSFLFSRPKSQQMSTTWVPNRYPSTRRSEHVDIYQSASRGEVAVPDPYQWLETDSDETDKWTSAQEAFTRDYLDRNPDLQRLRTAIQDSIDYQRVGTSVYATYCILIFFLIAVRSTRFVPWRSLVLVIQQRTWPAIL